VVGETLKIGQEGDKRKFRRLKKSDYYEAKAAAEAEEVTRWVKCKCCGDDITGKDFGGYCFRCSNEPL